MIIKNAVCDNCYKHFSVKKLESVVMEDDISVEKNYFICPNCGKEYVVNYADIEFRQNINRIIAIGDKIAQLRYVIKGTKKISNVQYVKNYNEFSRLLKEQRELIDKNKAVSQKYKEKYKEVV
ncbi:hypothetical protein [Clostridium kluyveri]|uniref:hypothetical protein n=1 Tax=Clostridium kluyveri TaxID=1534 RepID=UPI002245C99D|nr:hypothetical protein [Clostridium kluyveri]UZQ49103.1 hypothetical protein OP486_14190 [Clostridium kluyveri]